MKKPTRKPRLIGLPGVSSRIENGLIYLETGYIDHTPKEARKLARWLIQASEYLESRKK